MDLQPSEKPLVTFDRVSAFILSHLGSGDSAPGKWQTDISIQKSRSDIGLDMWRSMDVGNLSTARFYLVPKHDPVILFDVDFLSRHEIILPEENGYLPDGWGNWGVVKGNNLLVSSRDMLMRSMFTADAFIALPLYRFDHVADDVTCRMSEDNVNVAKATFLTLMSPILGYSFRAFVDDGATTSPKFDHSILTEAFDESSDLCRSALESLGIREG